MADYNWSNKTWPHPYDSDNGAWDTVSERRVALDGYSYTAEECQQHYGPSWEQIWTNRVSTVLPRRRARSSTRSRSPSASRDQPTTAATPPADDSELAADGGNVSQLAADGGNVSQLSANSIRLHPSMVIQVRQQEAARGPPRSLHKLARDALNQISQNPAYRDENLDNWFDWIPYVAAHTSCDQMERVPGASWQRLQDDAKLMFQ